MKNTILFLVLIVCNSIFSQEIVVLSDNAVELYNKKKYSQVISESEKILAREGDDVRTYYSKSTVCYLLWKIYKDEKFEGYDINLSYSSLKKSIEYDLLLMKKNNRNHTEKTRLELELDQMVQLYPGCENGTYVSKKNVSTNSINPTTEVQNSPNTSSNTQIDKPTSERSITITVSGSGKTQDEAKQSALRSAIEQAFGTFISAKTEILNDQVISDQITSVASGNIQAYDVLNQSQLPDGTWGITLKAIVSIDKLTSFVEAKGVSVEIKGGLFAMNIKQQLINEQAEIYAIAQLVNIMHNSIQQSFDYTIKSGEPQSKDFENQNWEIPLCINVIANKNINFCASYFIKTLASLSLSKSEIDTYKTLNKKTFPVSVKYKSNEYRFDLRKEISINFLKSFSNNWKYYLGLFDIMSSSNEYPEKDLTIDWSKSNWFSFSSIYNYDILPYTFLDEGQSAATYYLTDRKTLTQIEKITNYSVKPRAVVSTYKYGGYVVNEQNGHGLVVAMGDIGTMNWYEAKAKCDDLVLNGFNDWRLPTKEELQIIFNNFVKKDIGFYYQKIFWSSTEIDINSVTCVQFHYCDFADVNKAQNYSVLAVRTF